MEHFAPVPYFVWFRKNPAQGESTSVTSVRFQRLFDALMDFFADRMTMCNNLKIVGESRTDILEPLYYMNFPEYCMEMFFFHRSSQWLVSVRSIAEADIKLEWDRMIDPSRDERQEYLLQVPDWVFGSYAESQKEFSFSINSSQIYAVMLYLTKAASKHRS